MTKLNTETIGKIAKVVCVVGFYSLLVPSFKVKVNISKKQGVQTAEYSDAVKAIVESDMWPSDKKDAVAILKRGENSDYYKAIIAVVNDSDMWASDKLETIHSL